MTGSLSFTAVALMVLVSGSYATGTSFTITDSVYLTYSTSAQRDVFLQQVKVIWRNSLSSLYQATDVDLAFLDESDAGTSGPTSTGTSRMLVKYQVTGKSSLQVDFVEAKADFRQSLVDAHLANVEAVGTDMTVSSYATSSSESSSSSSESDAVEDASSSDDMKSFSFMDKVLMTYATTAERDELIRQIQLVWSNTLSNLYKATGVTVTFVRERVVITSSGLTRNEVTFRVSGRSRSTISVSAAKSAFRRAFGLSPIRNVEIITETTTYTSSTSTNTNDDMSDSSKTVKTKKTVKTVKKTEKHDSDNVDDEPVRVNVGGFGRTKAKSFSTSSSYKSTASDSDAGQAVSSSSDDMKSFSFMDKVLMTYATVDERDELIRQIQLVWSNTLSDLYQAIGVTVTFVRERVVITSSGSTRNEVTFRVSGRSRTAITVSEAKTEFRRAFGLSPIRNVEIITETTTYTSSTTTNTDTDMSDSGMVTEPVETKKVIKTKNFVKTVKKTEQHDSDETEDEPVRVNVGGFGRVHARLPYTKGSLDRDVTTTVDNHNDDQAQHDMSDMVKKSEVKKSFKKVTTDVDSVDTDNDGVADEKVVKKTVRTKNVKVTKVEDNTDDVAPQSLYHSAPASTRITFNSKDIRPHSDYPYRGVPYWLRNDYRAAYTNDDDADTEDVVTTKVDVVKTSKKVVEDLDTDGDGVSDQKVVKKFNKVVKTKTENVDDDRVDDSVDAVKKVNVVKKSFKKTTTDSVDENGDGVADVTKKTVYKSKNVKVDKAEEQTYDDSNDDGVQESTTTRYISTFPNVQHVYSAPKVKATFTSHNSMADNLDTVKKVNVVKKSFKKTTTDTVDNNDDGVADQVVKKTFTKNTKNVNVEESSDDNVDVAPQSITRYTAPKPIVKVRHTQPTYFKSSNTDNIDDNVDTVKKVDVVKTSKKVTKVEEVDNDNDGETDEKVVKKTMFNTKKVTKTEVNADDNVDLHRPVSKVYTKTNANFNRARGYAKSSSNNYQRSTFQQMNEDATAMNRDATNVDSTSKTLTSSSQASPVNSYIIYDTLSINSNDNDDIEVYIHQVENAWTQVIGKGSDIHLSIYDNQTSGSVETMKYLVVIFSHVADLNLVSLKSQFYAIKPVASVGGQTAFSSSTHSNAVVLRDVITFSYKNEQERDDFVDGIEDLWQSALGGGFQLIEAWLFDELVIDTTSESSGKTASQLSYAVVVVSEKYQLSVSALQSSFQQYLITKSVFASKMGSCGFQTAFAA